MTNSDSKWVQPKSVMASKTIWVNVLTLLVGILLLVSQQEWLPEHIIPILLTAVAVINIILRFLTDQPIQFLKSKSNGSK